MDRIYCEWVEDIVKHLLKHAVVGKIREIVLILGSREMSHYARSQSCFGKVERDMRLYSWKFDV